MDGFRGSALQMDVLLFLIRLIVRTPSPWWLVGMIGRAMCLASILNIRDPFGLSGARLDSLHLLKEQKDWVI